MKQIFIIIYTVINTYPAPCPDSKSQNFGCLVNHGWTRDTTQIEVITSDTLKLKEILKDDPKAKVDTFLLIPVNH